MILAVISSLIVAGSAIAQPPPDSHISLSVTMIDNQPEVLVANPETNTVVVESRLSGSRLFDAPPQPVVSGASSSAASPATEATAFVSLRNTLLSSADSLRLASPNASASSALVDALFPDLGSLAGEG